MITVSLLPTATVDVLKCVYFQLVKTLKEIDWYGLSCNKEEYINDIELAFVYLESIDTGCTLTHQFECEIKTFITKKSSYCIFTSDACTSTTSVITQQNYLITEADDPIMTESDENIIV